MDGEQQFCDLCGSRTGVEWAYTTPNVVASLEEAEAQGTFWCEDEVWHICDTCHRMIQNGRREQLLERASLAIDEHQLHLAFNEEGVMEKVDPREQVTFVHECFWEHKADGFEKISA